MSTERWLACARTVQCSRSLPRQGNIARQSIITSSKTQSWYYILRCDNTRHCIHTGHDGRGTLCFGHHAKATLDADLACGRFVCFISPVILHTSITIRNRSSHCMYSALRTSCGRTKYIVDACYASTADDVETAHGVWIHASALGRHGVKRTQRIYSTFG